LGATALVLTSLGLTLSMRIACEGQTAGLLRLMGALVVSTIVALLSTAGLAVLELIGDSASGAIIIDSASVYARAFAVPLSVALATYYLFVGDLLRSRTNRIAFAWIPAVLAAAYFTVSVLQIGGMGR